MTSRLRLLIIGGGSVVALLLCWWAVHVWVQVPGAAIEARIQAARQSLDRRNDDLDRAGDVDARLAAVTSRTLGDTTEVVDLVLRSRLSAIAEAAGVQDVRVSTGRPSMEGTPGASSFKSKSVRELRDEPDFALVEATVAAEGTWKQVTAMLDAIRAEPWPHRITSVRLAAGNNAERIDVTIRLVALFVPGEAPSVDVQLEPLQLATRIDRASPFAIPVVTPVQPAVPAAPKVAWRVTHIGLVQGEPEVLVQSKSGDRRRLVAGDVVAGMQLVAVEPDADGFDTARFRLKRGGDDTQWTVQPGEALQRP